MTINREQIKQVFLAHGFTVKPGQDDLKEYVYAAAEALIAQAQAAPGAELVAFEDSWPSIAAELPEHHRSNYCAGDVYAAERDAALAGWAAHAKLFTAPQHDAELVELLRDARDSLENNVGMQDGYIDYDGVHALKIRIDAKLATLSAKP